MEHTLGGEGGDMRFVLCKSLKYIGYGNHGQEILRTKTVISNQDFLSEGPNCSSSLNGFEFCIQILLRTQAVE